MELVWSFKVATVGRPITHHNENCRAGPSANFSIGSGKGGRNQAKIEPNRVDFVQALILGTDGTHGQATAFGRLTCGLTSSAGERSLVPSKAPSAPASQEPRAIIHNSTDPPGP